MLYVNGVFFGGLNGNIEILNLGKVVVLDVKMGKVLWIYLMFGLLVGGVLVVKGMVFVGVGINVVFLWFIGVGIFYYGKLVFVFFLLLY